MKGFHQVHEFKKELLRQSYIASIFMHSSQHTC
jgi:hypothetical protein